MVESAAPLVLGLGVAAAFLLDWTAIAKDWKAIKQFTKPLAMVMLILWTAFSAAYGVSLPVGWLLAAQIFGLLGDILLLLLDKAFLAGLCAFLVGHLIYLGLLIDKIIALVSGDAPRFEHIGAVFAGGLLWGGILFLVSRLFRHLQFQKRISEFLWLGIQVYSWVLSGMTVLALMTALLADGTLLERVALPAGALLFLISDSMLAYNRFIESFDCAQLWVRITYHLAQFGLAWAFLVLVI